MTERTGRDFAALRRKQPEEALAILTDMEGEIRRLVSPPNAGSADGAGPVGIPIVDWLVDQILFVRHAWRWLWDQDLGDEESLWGLEMLSLPECYRRAQSPQRLKRLLEEALVKENLRWRDVLWHRRWRPNLLHAAFVPRSVPILPRQLTPFASSVSCPKRWPNPWGFPLDLYLRIHRVVQGEGNALLPYQWFPHKHGMAFSIQLNSGMVIFDIPRQYDRTQCVARLTALKISVEEALHPGQSPFGTNGSSPGGAQQCPRLVIQGRPWGDPAAEVASPREQMQNFLGELTQDLERLEHGRLSGAQRAALLQRYFAVPGTVLQLHPVQIVPLDLSPELLCVVMGAWLYLHGGLSVREQRRFQRFVERHILIRRRDLAPGTAGRLVPGLILRLGRFDRPLRGASVGRYLRRVLQDVEETASEVVSPLRSSSSAGGERLERGALQRAAARLGCHVRTVARRYQRFCDKYGLPRSLAAWDQFRKHLRRNTGR